eukprot:CAMPEP_0198601314 /NCGR_PEP_ID=MMETSP1462-20131121/149364_1 /TAXON_ID=1333877 /ORGANISM="Brandtodinium nutriculum, Strain RCC3387" /LENGTH=74 /DNA_ID=CAMNT_0044333043 /DNA_START=114 /DNA_END=334 /DNA_ORIENTATION=-
MSHLRTSGALAALAVVGVARLAPVAVHAISLVEPCDPTCALAELLDPAARPPRVRRSKELHRVTLRAPSVLRLR